MIYAGHREDARRALLVQNPGDATRGQVLCRVETWSVQPFLHNTSARPTNQTTTNKPTTSATSQYLEITKENASKAARETCLCRLCFFLEQLIHLVTDAVQFLSMSSTHLHHRALMRPFHRAETLVIDVLQVVHQHKEITAMLNPHHLTISSKVKPTRNSTRHT